MAEGFKRAAQMRPAAAGVGSDGADAALLVGTRKGEPFLQDADEWEMKASARSRMA